MPSGAPDLECTERNAITYCYFPGYGSWVPHWRRVAEPIAAAVPPERRHRMPTIAQHTSFRQPAVAGDMAMVRMVWGRGEAGRDDRTELASQIAELVTGVPVLNLPRYFPAPGPPAVAGDELSGCDETEQASVVIALWLVAQAAPQRLQTAGTAGEYAEALLGRAGVRELIWEHWDLLLDPDTTIGEAVPLLGLADEPGGEPCG